MVHCTFKLEPDAPQLRLVLNDVNIEHDVRCLFVKNSDVMFLSILCTGPRVKYHVKILAFSVDGDGYQAHQTVNTPACPCESIHFTITSSNVPLILYELHIRKLKLHVGIRQFHILYGTFIVVYHKTTLTS